MLAEVKIDYFATSLPDFLLFEDDLQKRNRIECLFLRGLASLGLSRPVDGTADLGQVLSMDPTHLFARLELRSHCQPVEEAPSPMSYHRIRSAGSPPARHPCSWLRAYRLSIPRKRSSALRQWFRAESSKVSVQSAPALRRDF